MKVLFVQDVLGTAYAGDIKDVKPGFARNYLLPRKLAVQATKDQLNRVEGLRTAASKRREVAEADLNALAERIDGMTVVIEGRAGRNDRLYGAVTNVLVAEHMAEILGREVDRRRIAMDPIRQLGTYEIPVKLYAGIEPKVTLVVTAPGRPVVSEEATGNDLEENTNILDDSTPEPTGLEGESTTDDSTEDHAPIKDRVPTDTPADAAEHEDAEESEIEQA